MKNLNCGLIIVIFLIIAIFVYAYINRYEIKIDTFDNTPAIVKFDRWTGKAKIKLIFREVNKSADKWIEIREFNPYDKFTPVK